MTTVLPTNKTLQPLDSRLLLSGLLGIQGINQSRDRQTLGDYDCWYVENLEPTPLGWTNNKIGVCKLNESKLSTAKVQGVFSYNTEIIFIANGSVYKITDSSPNPTLVTGGANIFDSSATVRGMLNQGKSGTLALKLYLCDGISPTPKAYDGTAVSSFALGNYAAPASVTNWRSRTVWTFRKDTPDQNRILFSAQEDGDDYNLSGLSMMDAFDDECFPNDGDHIVGLGQIQFKGQDAQKDALVICKSKSSFLAIDIDLNDNVRTTTFNAHGVDIGAVSPDSILQFGNDLWILTNTGVRGFNSVLDGSGGVASFSQSPSNRIDRLINDASKSTAFSNSFALHHANRQKIRFFMPRDANASASTAAFEYPEIPNNYALCYSYGLLSRTDTNPNGEAFYARAGEGFAFSCGCIHNGKMILGDYFGDLYELDGENGTDDYVLGDATDRIIKSSWETPFMMFELPFGQTKRILEWNVHGRSLNTVEYNTDITIIHSSNPKRREVGTITQFSSAADISTSVWGGTTWGGSTWSGSAADSHHTVKMRPAGWGNAFGIKHWFYSKRLLDGTMKSNGVWIYAFSGFTEQGSLRA